MATPDPEGITDATSAELVKSPPNNMSLVDELRRAKREIELLKSMVRFISTVQRICCNLLALILAF